jgi:hypothetical protein
MEMGGSADNVNSEDSNTPFEILAAETSQAIVPKSKSARTAKPTFRKDPYSFATPSTESSSQSDSQSDTEIVEVLGPPRSPVAEECLVDDIDFPYFTFFLHKMPIYFEYTIYFPELVPILLAHSVAHTAMRHTILSMSSMSLDTARNQPLVRFYRHRHKAITHLQDALAHNAVDIGVAIAIYLFAWMDYSSGFQESGHKHLCGLFMITEHFRKQGQIGVCIALRKMAIRTDFWSAYMSGRTPAFPALTSEGIYHQPPWLGIFALDTEIAQWAAASFVLDALWHRTCHMHLTAEQSREEDGSLPPFTMIDLIDLEIAHRQWLSLPIIIKAEQREREAQQLPCQPLTPRFLHYDPIRIHDRQYVTLLNHWRGIKIYISLIQYPEMGPGPAMLERVPTAIEICRTYAAGIQRPGGPLWNLLPMSFAGVAFGGENRYPMESRWVLEKIAESGITEFPMMMHIFKRVWKFWSYKGNYMQGMKLLAGVDSAFGD